MGCQHGIKGACTRCGDEQAKARLKAETESLRTRADELESRLNGALGALRELREIVPPRDWKQYAQAVIELEDRSPARRLRAGVA